MAVSSPATKKSLESYAEKHWPTMTTQEKKAIMERMARLEDYSHHHLIQPSVMAHAAQMGVQDNKSVLDDGKWRLDAIRSRMHLKDREATPYEFVATAHVEKRGVVVVFVIQDGQPVTLEDEAVLFPSDKLLASLRLLEK